MSILFQTLRWKNFLSTGNDWTEIKLNRSRSTLIVGSNGAGKSTMIDALSFALYGKPFRNINKPQLVNSITQKGTVVEIEFKVNNKEYRVVRGIKPAVFEIYMNGTLLSQSADVREYQEFLETQIIRMNWKAFSQIIVLGNANYTPFMQLPAWHRREVIEDLLDLQVFSRMNALLKDKIAANKEAAAENTLDIRLINHKIELQKKHEEAINKNITDIVESKKYKVLEYVEKIQQTKEKIETIGTELRDLEAKYNSQYERTYAKYSELTEFRSKFAASLVNINNQLIFFHDNDTCPTCKQNIEPDFKHSAMSAKITKRTELMSAIDKADKSIEKYRTKLNELDEMNTQIQRLRFDIQSESTLLTSYREARKDLLAEIDALLNETTSKITTSDMDDHNKELKSANRIKEKLANERNLLEVAANMLKDNGIKTKIIKQYVPVINKLINKYLAQMEFFVNFELNEKFEETIKSRHRDVFTYASFSEGEKARLDLALILAWRAIAKLRNSSSSNLLILDEVFDGSLDGVGTDYLLEVFNGFEDGTNLFVISHKQDVLFDKFHSAIRFEKIKSFSKIAT